MRKEIPFESEYSLHRLTQNHLKELFDLEFVASEIQLNNLRLDNLAFDAKSNTFAVIEYKNEFDANILNQTQDYCNLISENQEFFLSRLENEENDDFENINVIIIGPEFSQDQINKSKDNFNLWKVTLFDDGTVEYINLKTGEVKTLKIDLKELEITEESLLEGKSEKMIDLYFNLKEKILNEFDDLEIKFLVDQFSIRANDSIICVIRFLTSSFNINLTGKNLKNTDRTTDISDKSEVGNYRMKYESEEDYDYFLDLFKQTYLQKVKK